MIARAKLQPAQATGEIRVFSRSLFVFVNAWYPTNTGFRRFDEPVGHEQNLLTLKLALIHLENHMKSNMRILSLAAAANVVNIVASGYKYDAPATIPAGLTTFHLTNTGKEPHQANLIRLDSGKTYADLVNGVKNMKPGAPPPGWVVPAGGPNADAPRVTVDVTTRAEGSR